MGNMHGKQIIARLQAAGWTVARINGSHHVMVKGALSVPIPVHGTKDIGPGLVSRITRQTGVQLK